MKQILLVIDNQNDFTHPDGALYVDGAEESVARLATFIREKGDHLSDIVATMDSHHQLDIAHPVMWVDESGDSPDPFQIISREDVEDGTWRAAHPGMQDWCEDYVKSLEDNGRYPLCIWPPHCLIGTWGHNFYEDIRKAFFEWERENFGIISTETKGSNFKTEHYSIFQADVPDPNDPTTQLNTKLIERFSKVDRLIISGQASSHCVANSVTDLANNFGDEQVKKIVLLTDTMDPVANFEQQEQDFYDDMESRGVTLTTSTEYLS